MTQGQPPCGPRALLAGASRLLRAHPAAFALLALGGLAAAAALFPFDRALLEAITDNDTRAMRDIARAISFWGDFPTGSLILSAALWTAGFLLQRPRWRVAALAALLASASAGITANALRLSLGRPRPSADVADQLHGPRGDHRYHAFPSGHSATAMGTAAALAAALPPLAAPAAAGALAVGWSRLYLKQHHPSDVAAGFTFGIFFGIAFGLAARRQQ